MVVLKLIDWARLSFKKETLLIRYGGKPFVSVLVCPVTIHENSTAHLLLLDFFAVTIMYTTDLLK